MCVDDKRLWEKSRPGSGRRYLLGAAAVSPQSIVSRHLFRDFPGERLRGILIEIDRLAKPMISALVDLRKEAEVARSAISNNPPDGMRRVFAVMIGRDFELLTGRPPAPGDGPFLDYLAAAASIAFDEECDWAGIVLKVYSLSTK
jgi:hypothetical protein